MRLVPAVLLAVFAAGPLAASPRQCVQKVLAPTPVMGESFGWAADIDGDVAVFAAYAGEAVGALPGAVYVYERVPGGWTHAASLTASDGFAGDQFGSDVAIDGDTIAVGARRAHGVVPSAGAVYVFERGPAGWVETVKLVAGDGSFEDFLGQTVALDGDTLLTGARDDELGTDSGSVYVFERNPAGWVETGKLLASDGLAQDAFGSEGLALQGDTALIGAHGADPLGSLSGRAYVFERAGGAWTETQRIVASDGGPDARFGSSTSLSGARALIAARTDGDGAVYAFERTGAGWVERQKILPPNSTFGEFGDCVSLSGDRAVVGSPGDDFLGNYTGAAYVYERTAAGWVETRRLVATDSQAQDFFGVSVAIDGGTVLVGAHRDDDACPALPNCNSGSGHVFDCVGTVGTSYCGANLNSTGLPGVILVTGSVAVAEGDLRLVAAQLPAQRFGYFLVSMHAASMQPPGSSGVLCLGLPCGRFNAVADIIRGPSGGIDVDLGALPLSPPVAVQPGDTWRFQCWYRDTGGGNNFTDAVAVTFR